MKFPSRIDRWEIFLLLRSTEYFSTKNTERVVQGHPKRENGLVERFVVSILPIGATSHAEIHLLFNRMSRP
jgi:hypothetical protein